MSPQASHPDAPRITRGRRLPHGATPDERGVNFSVWSRHASSVELLLYDDLDAPEPSEIIPLDPAEHRTHFSWHVHVAGLGPGIAWAWRVDGPADTAATGRRFHPGKPLLDPFARAVSFRRHDRLRAADASSSGEHLPRGIVAAPLPPATGWRPLSLEGAVIYELHVGTFTKHPSSGVKAPGTFAGLAEKIPYLRDLGVTHVELLPVAAFDEQDAPAGTRALGLRNVWGYSPASFFAPHPRYCAGGESADAPAELRAMVDAFHDAGLGVLVDVVFNHTAEGGDDGPWISWKGLCNDEFYHLDPSDRRRSLDFTGCGNSVRCNGPVASDAIVRALEWWALDLGVDGFRFDLASELTRGDLGVPLPEPPLPWQVETSRALEDRVLIAEPWDATGLSHEGRFPGLRWAEWNARFRDGMRRFARGDEGIEGDAARLLAGSEEMFAPSGRLPAHSVNFVTSHDGFTLWDVVSHSRKHNAGNGEDGRDGRDDEPCWNGGAEGATDDPDVLARRRRDARNLLALTLLSLGTPMLLAGDEMLRTQRGNNNAWCHDDELTWLDWRLAERNAGFLRFTRELIALRRRHPLFARGRFLRGEALPGRGLPDVRWHGARLDEPPWSGGPSRVLGCTLAGAGSSEPDLHLAFNMSDDIVEAELPEAPGRSWHLALDTSRETPDDVVPPGGQSPFARASLRLAPRSIVALEAR